MYQNPFIRMMNRKLVQIMHIELNLNYVENTRRSSETAKPVDKSVNAV